MNCKETKCIIRFKEFTDLGKSSVKTLKDKVGLKEKSNREREKKMQHIKTVSKKLLALLLTFALVLTMTPTTAFATTTGDEGSSYADDTVPSSPDTATVTWNGLTWDIIGYNTGSIAHGVAGPTGTATLLLDKSSYDSSNNTHFYDTEEGEPVSNEYQNSDLQAKLNTIWNGLSDKNNVVQLHRAVSLIYQRSFQKMYHSLQF